MQKLYENIKEGVEVRQSLAGLRAALREKEKGEENLARLRENYEREPELFLALLQTEDAKARKNAALVLGAIGTDECRDALLAAYQAETQRFVKSAYLTGLKGCDCAGLTEFLREKRRELLAAELTEETQKHIREELEAVNALLSRYESAKRRSFCMAQEPVDVILTTWREYREKTAEQITAGKVSFAGAGIRVDGGDLRELLAIRTFRELLFCLDMDEVREEGAAEALAASNLRKLLQTYYRGDAPWRFRIECRSRMTLEQRSAFTKKLADGLMRETGGLLLNDVSDYEAELRLIEKRSGGFLPLLKLPGLPDHRFAYRKNSVAASMQPSLAALLMELAGPYLKEKARVLDPFCGVGTLLLERNYRTHADTLYGVDSFGPAIQGARENASIAGVPAHFVNRDIRGFRHEYLFDEIVTDMPSQGGRRTAHEVDFLHRVLFERAGELLKPGAMLFVYTHDRGFAKKWMRECGGMKLEKEWQISAKEDSWFLAVRYGG